MKRSTRMVEPITLAIMTAGFLGVSEASAQTTLDSPNNNSDATSFSFNDEAGRQQFINENPDLSSKVVDPTATTNQQVTSEGNEANIDAVLDAEGSVQNNQGAALQSTTTEGKMRELSEAMRNGMADASASTGIENLARSTPVHTFQRAWEKSQPNEGVFESPYCASCVYKMQVRELMVSNFVLPQGEQIISYDIGDAATFQAEVRGDNILAIAANTFGVDTNINVYTENGRVYPLYVRALEVQSHLLPDLVFRVIDPTIKHTKVKPLSSLSEASNLIDAPARIDTSKLVNNLKPENISVKDFLKDMPFDPGKLRFDGFKVYGSNDRKLAPSRVFRDEKFVYIQYDNPTRIPGFAAYSVVDDVDEKIATRVSGNTFIIEGISDLISLKSGDSYLCISLDRDVA